MSVPRGLTPGGIFPRGDVCPYSGVCPQREVCPLGGGLPNSCPQRGVCLIPHVNRQTLLKTLPSLAIGYSKSVHRNLRCVSHLKLPSLAIGYSKSVCPSDICLQQVIAFTKRNIQCDTNYLKDTRHSCFSSHNRCKYIVCSQPIRCPVIRIDTSFIGRHTA